TLAGCRFHEAQVEALVHLDRGVPGRLVSQRRRDTVIVRLGRLKTKYVVERAFGAGVGAVGQPSIESLEFAEQRYALAHFFSGDANGRNTHEWLAPEKTTVHRAPARNGLNCKVRGNRGGRRCACLRSCYLHAPLNGLGKLNPSARLATIRPADNRYRFLVGAAQKRGGR